MRAFGRWMVGCLVTIASVVLVGFEQSDAAAPKRTTTIAKVEALMDQIEQRRKRSAQSGLVSAPDLESSLENWRPWRSRREKPVKIQRMKAAPKEIPRLIADAICKQDAASLRLAQRLDVLLNGQLFDHREAMISNEIARRNQLDISFQRRMVPVGDQALKEINRIRSLKRLLREGGPVPAIEKVRSLQRLCAVNAAD